MRKLFHVYIKMQSILDCENPTCLIFLLSRIKSKLFHTCHVSYLTSWTWSNFIQFYFLTVSKYRIKTKSKQNTHNRQLSRNFVNRVYFSIYIFISELFSYSIEPFFFVIVIVQSYYFPSKPYLSAPPGANETFHCLLKSYSISS